ncbi:MAG: hypothetical protein WC485_02390 [Opitutaceae bacterium]
MDHVRQADERQTAIYRQMTPTQRLQQAVRMNQRMRLLMDAGLRAQHPEWSAAERKRIIAERILHARTG